MKIILTAAASLLLVLSFAGCTPKPGTEAWCKQIQKQPKGDWTANEAATYTKYCVMGSYKK